VAETLDDATYDDPFDFGEGVRGCYIGWAPDRELNPQYEGIPDEPRYSLILFHQTPEGAPCSGAVTFDGEVQQRVEASGRSTWTVESWDPLTLSPSILCQRCGHHGFIREGRWVDA
jgi:hypothetical protein